MKLKDLSIATQLRLGLGIILLFVLLLGYLAWRQTEQLSLQTRILYNHPMKVRLALGDLETDIMGMRLEYRNLLLATDEKGRQTALNNSAAYQADAYHHFNALFEAYLGPRSDIEEAHMAFARWISARESNRALARQGKITDAMNRVSNSGDIGIERELLLKQVKTIDTFSREKADSLYREAAELSHRLTVQLVVIVCVILLLSSLILFLLLKMIRTPLKDLGNMADQFRKGKMDARCSYISASEFGVLAGAFNALADTIQNDMNFRDRIAQLNAVMLLELQMRTFNRQVLDAIMRLTDSQIGAIYLLNEQKSDYELLESIGVSTTGRGSFSATTCEGEFGAALTTKQIQRITDIPPGALHAIATVSGELLPHEIITIPLLAGDDVPAMLSLASIHPYDPDAVRLITEVQDVMAVWINSMLANQRVETLAVGLDQQNRQLQTQQEELRVANEELEEQTQRLQQSEEELKVQQEELQVTNEELEEKNDLLERQTKQVELARLDLEEKSEALARASKYKSEFLANMSHELRTPLNSLLLLSQGLAGNRDGNLTSDQVEAARIIYAGGSDLLNLINEILDLSKIEAGRIDIQFDSVKISDLADGVRETFQLMADEKGIALQITVNDDAPVEIASDRKRLEQITRNLIANALKFTAEGGVSVTFGAAENDSLAIKVKDTGIGIPPELHKLIFNAFQQADGTTSRKYGGTGLGLSISRELAALLGGEIRLESEVGKGATFTLLLPVTCNNRPNVETAKPIEIAKIIHKPVVERRRSHIPDDRDSIAPDDHVILVIEDDLNFARLLCAKCHEKGIKCLAAPTGEEGLELAAKHQPGAVILDLRLPGIDGWEVLSVLKENTATRHIPVHIMSVEDPTSKAQRKGAVGHFAKPVNQEELEEAFRRLEQLSSGKPKRLLVVDDDAAIRLETVKLVSGVDVTTDEAQTGEQALAALRSTVYDCVVLDLGLPDMDGNELLARLESEGLTLPPVIVYTARDLTVAEETTIRGRAESIVIKDVRSQERLLDEVSLFLHRIVNRMPEKKRKVIQDLHDTDALLKGKKILVVDDDMRTTFAVAHLLTGSGMKPLKAENGERALRLLDEQPDIDLVLMDIMMPVMDGYETMKRIRAQDKFRTLPIIALTAKAMEEDREKCLAVGANDYLPKPVDPARLFSLMRVWLCR